ncbi:chemotaxis protein CheA [Falsihalocynthiibacter arcticus]|uniref:Chemotaxis protein CheA n=1 Tax=Falsihalocynthiibacter arcticus TaxID=1579316 RepID=A0A126V3N6_9RHOB|nr:chemotaxis protein CheA [Falsihalocynthiibacter arcticus]AML52934.1 chemotaxis protein CheA [Falsihalocynthiibacter arcticus]
MSEQIDPMAEIRTAFFQECEELLEALQDGLMSMEDGSSDGETINVVFRAVHSIKGGAGAFGLDELVRFAHRYETTLDHVRSGTLAPEGDALKVFFRAADLLSDIVRASRDATETDKTPINEVLELLLDLIGGEEEEEEEMDPADFVATGVGFSLDLSGLDMDLPAFDEPDIAFPDISDLPVDVVPEDCNSTVNEKTVSQPDEDPLNAYKISFTPTSELYATGNEPIFIFRTLRNMGKMSINVDQSKLPDLEDLAAEENYLTWNIILVTDESKAQILEAFDFVADICELTIEATKLLPVELEIVSQSTDASQTKVDKLLPPKAEDPIPSTVQVSPIAPASAESPDDVVDSTPSSLDVKSVPREGPRRPEEETAAIATKPRATVRVDLERVDRLVNLVGELVINQAMLSQSVAEAGLPPNAPVFTGLDELQQLTRDIQDSVMMIRAQPVKTLFQRMARIVRESSAAVEKEVHLDTVGEGTEVDKTVIERLADPLTHMIRNAVDHGLENTQDRLAAGKPRVGVISLSARHRSGRVVIDVSDDGGGINRPKVLEKAIAKGLVADDAQLTDSEIDNILFLPGFSTADQISNLSGRGVGMDVVRSAIQSLGGRVTITSTAGVGTTFSISLPLTLAVLDGMVIQVAGQTLVIPLNTIDETLTLGEGDISSFGPHTSVVRVRNGFVPLLDLGSELGYRKPQADYVGSIVLLIAHEDGSRAALVVDEIRDQRQVVIKGLQEGYGRVPGIAAATILGDGQIALILDPVDIVSGASGCTVPSETPIELAG